MKRVKVFISAYKGFSLFSSAFVVFYLRFSSKRDILNFRIMGVRDTRLSKNIYLSRDF